jgi:hypothetical protein
MLIQKDVKCEGLKLTTSTIVDLWDERIKRIKLVLLYIAEDEISFYGFIWTCSSIEEV